MKRDEDLITELFKRFLIVLGVLLTVGLFVILFWCL
jgi:hypothetical protein